MDHLENGQPIFGLEVAGEIFYHRCDLVIYHVIRDWAEQLSLLQYVQHVECHSEQMDLET